MNFCMKLCIGPTITNSTKLNNPNRNSFESICFCLKKALCFVIFHFLPTFGEFPLTVKAQKGGKTLFVHSHAFGIFVKKRIETEKNFFSLLFYFLWLLKKLWNCQSLYPFISWTETLLHFGVGTIPIVVHRYCGVIQKWQTTITAYCRILYCRPLHRQPIIFLNCRQLDKQN
jgi:hypothetical protein